MLASCWVFRIAHAHCLSTIGVSWIKVLRMTQPLRAWSSLRKARPLTLWPCDAGCWRLQQSGDFRSSRPPRATSALGRVRSCLLSKGGWMRCRSSWRPIDPFVILCMWHFSALRNTAHFNSRHEFFWHWLDFLGVRKSRGSVQQETQKDCKSHHRCWGLLPFTW